MKLFNTLSRSKEDFTPIDSNQVGLYTCGPTVYDYVHIGNLRSYIFSDLLVRALRASGYTVKHVMNITDIDDKTIKRSQEEKKPLSEVTERYTKFFLDDLKSINAIQPDVMPKATGEIDGMVELVKILLDKGMAYKAENGDIYFDISALPDYGKLAQLDAEGLKQNAEGRLNNADEYEKDDARDFALWKAYSPADGNVFWETEIGKGRPGWHIECSVMSSKYLGQPFDLHVGGVDLIFPHHTNEIAQSEGAYGKPLAHYWMHPEHLLVDNTKMAKSKKNFFTSRDILDKGFEMMAFRYLIVSSHYRSKLNFTWDSLQGAQNALTKLYQDISVYDEPASGLPDFEQAFSEAINDDLNTAKALGIMWDLVKSNAPSGDKLASLLKFDEVFGLNIKQNWEAARAIPESVQALAKARDEARVAKDFAKSDELRKQIEAAGYIAEDSPSGTRLKKK